jgi:hypothetical protein
LTLEVLKVNIFRFKMQNDPIWAYNQMVEKSSAPQKKPKIDLWEIRGCAQIQEIERPGTQCYCMVNAGQQAVAFSIHTISRPTLEATGKACIRLPISDFFSATWSNLLLA